MASCPRGPRALTRPPRAMCGARLQPWIAVEHLSRPSQAFKDEMGGAPLGPAPESPLFPLFLVFLSSLV